MKRAAWVIAALFGAACTDGGTAPPPSDSNPARDVGGSGLDRGSAAEGLADTSSAADGKHADAAGKPDAGPAPDHGATKPDHSGLKPDGGAACDPFCCNIGTKSEGWCDCKGTLLFWDSCAACTPLCKNCGTGCKSNGWYSSCDITKVIEYATCNECSPRCDAVGTFSEGWYDCNGTLLNDPLTGKPYYAACSTCAVTCTYSGPGSKTNGYYSSCTGTAILYADCVP